MATIDSLRDTLAAHNQEHVLAYYDELTAEQQAQLCEQLSAIDWQEFDDWVEGYVTTDPEFHVPDDIEPADYFPLEPSDESQVDLYQRADSRGWELLRQGRVAAFTVAGGQGTRLGFDGPKGTFPISPIKDKTLFQLFADKLARYGELAGKPIPWYIMTSPMNDAPTRAYFAENDYLGLNPEDVMFFPQGTMPAFSYDGKLLLAAKDSLALSPDGHGGSLKALFRSGAIDDMTSRGIQHISYFQVDNPLVSVVSPLFLGLHELTGSEMSSRCLPKSEPFEKIGALCIVEGKLQVVEYSDLPDELATQTDADGNLRFRAGSPAIHIIRRDFVEDLNSGGSFSLPFHRAEKKIPHLDADGNLVEPTEPNGVKLETFVFDALPLATQSIVFEAKREDEFAPVKNKTGVDSVISSRQLQQEQHARWLASVGVDVPRDENGELACKLEISPRKHVDVDDFSEDDFAELSIVAGDEIYLA